LDTIHQHTPFFALYVAARARLLDSKLIVQGFPHEGFARSKQAPVARRIDPVNFDWQFANFSVHENHHEHHYCLTIGNCAVVKPQWNFPTSLPSSDRELDHQQDYTCMIVLSLNWAIRKREVWFIDDASLPIYSQDTLISEFNCAGSEPWRLALSRALQTTNQQHTVDNTTTSPSTTGLICKNTPAVVTMPQVDKPDYGRKELVEAFSRLLTVLLCYGDVLTTFPAYWNPKNTQTSLSLAEVRASMSTARSSALDRTSLGRRAKPGSKFVLFGSEFFPEYISWKSM